MYFLWAGLVLLLLKFLEIDPVTQLSWWWVLSPLGLAFLWFETFEKVFGRDKQTVEHTEQERVRAERIKAQFARFNSKTGKRGG